MDGDQVHTLFRAAWAGDCSVSAARATEQVPFFHHHRLVAIRSITEAGRGGAENSNDRNIARNCHMHGRTVVANDDLCAIDQRHKRLQIRTTDEIDPFFGRLFMHGLRHRSVVRSATDQDFPVTLSELVNQFCISGNGPAFRRPD